MRSLEVAVAFGRVLRELRVQNKLSQEELAFRGEFDRTYPSLLERGLRTPTLTVVLTLAEALGVAPAVLVSRTAEGLGPAVACEEVHTVSGKCGALLTGAESRRVDKKLASY